MEKSNFRLEYLYPKELDISSIKNKYFIFDFKETALTEIEKVNLDSIHICHGCNYYAKSGDELWKQENIKEGARILSRLPEYLPVYISRTANAIITELVGVNQFEVGLDSPKIYYLLGKMHLSVFLATIEQLLEDGINLAELPVYYSHFYYLSFGDSYRNIADEKSGDIYDVISAISSHCISKSQEQLLRKYCYYKDLREFLMAVKEIIERTEAKPLIPNPERLDYRKNKYFSDTIKEEEASYERNHHMYFSSIITPNFQPESLPEGEMVKAVEYIDKVINKLDIGAKKATKQIIFTLIKKILDALKKKEKSENDEEFIEKLKELLKTLDLSEQGKEELESALGKEDFEEFLSYIKQIREQNEKKELNKELQDLKNKIIEQLLEEIENCSQRRRKKELIAQLLNEAVNVELTNENKERMSNLFGDNDPEVGKNSHLEQEDTRTREDLLAEIKQLKEALANKERELEELRAIIFEYLKTGKNRPKVDSQYCSNEDIRKILKEYQENNRMSTIRKYLLIATLTVGSIVGTFALTNNKSQKELSNIESTSMVDSNLEEEENDENQLPIPDSNIPVIPTQEPIVDNSFQDSEEQIEDGYKKITEEIYLGKKAEINQSYIYQNIYELNPYGIASSEGIIIAYFPYRDVGGVREFYGALRSKKQLDEFIQLHRDEIENMKWKAAFTEITYEEEIKQFLSEGEVDARYTTFFVDFEPDLKKNKVYQY